jgi:hypothetical protein
MAKPQLVDVQLTRNGNPVGVRYVSEVDHTDPADRAGLFHDALTHARVDGAGCLIQVFRRGTDEELFRYPAG